MGETVVGVLIVKIGAPERTRTSTPKRAQVLNLPRMPIPPLGHLRTPDYTRISGVVKWKNVVAPNVVRVV